MDLLSDYPADKGTGSHDNLDDCKEIVYPFGRYEITVRLTPFKEFVGITAVKINRDFLSHRQKMASRGFHDVEEFYPE